MRNSSQVYSTVQKECKRISPNFATFRYFSTKYNEISGETKFRSKFVEFSKRLLFQSKRKFERPREFSNEISLRRSEISRLLIKSSQRKFVF